MEMDADTQSALQAAEHMHSPSGHATTALYIVQDAQADLDAVDGFQDTYLKPLRIFDDVIGKIADVHPYAKMALGVLSCVAKVCILFLPVSRCYSAIICADYSSSSKS
ncbi:hypothetical protein BDR07DRAFT_222972 [Suillus spraguei]|nr:hypothetical protein BDR07DRAFT_222972 [Suillus spraguei]